MEEILNLTKEELTEVVSSLGEKPYRAKQIYEWLHVKRVKNFDEMTNISSSFRSILKEKYILDPLEIVRKQESKEGETAKYLFSLPDGETIESVWMRYKHGDSICVSSQVGCRMGCSFCASTIDGLVRNLTAAEMCAQVYDIERDRDVRISNIIVMGMGEPFDNYDNLIRFIRLICDEEGRNLSARHITVSTCGLPDMIRRLADEGISVTLALSLHAPDDGLRKKIMPIAKAHALDEVLDACSEYFSKTGRRVTFEYSMIRGVNDDKTSAEKLAKRCKNIQKNGMPVHINLIPLNEVSERDLHRADEENIEHFKIILEKNRINVTIRREMGSDIDAACGQLRRNTR